jgi:hypothetical protein
MEKQPLSKLLIGIADSSYNGEKASKNEDIAIEVVKQAIEKAPDRLLKGEKLGVKGKRLYVYVLNENQYRSFRERYSESQIEPLNL